MEAGWEGDTESVNARERLMREELARDREVRKLRDFGSGSIVDQKSWHNNDINRGFQNRGVHRQATSVRFWFCELNIGTTRSQIPKERYWEDMTSHMQLMHSLTDCLVVNV